MSWVVYGNPPLHIFLHISQGVPLLCWQVQEEKLRHGPLASACSAPCPGAPPFQSILSGKEGLSKDLHPHARIEVLAWSWYSNLPTPLDSPSLIHRSDPVYTVQAAGKFPGTL